MTTALTLQSQQAITVKQIDTSLVNQFFQFLDVSPKTAATYERALRQMFAYFKAQEIRTPTYADIVSYKKALQAKGLKQASINLYIIAAHKFFAWLEQFGYYPNVAKDVKVKRVSTGHKRDFLSAKGIREALATIRDTRDTAIFSLIACCGLRTVEVVRANVEDLRTLNDELCLFVQGKGENEKTEFVKLPQKVAQVMKEYLATRGHVEPSAPLFVSRSNQNRGKRLTTTSVSGICKQAMRKAGYDSSRLTAHSLRHSAVTLALMKGVSLHEVSIFARHKDLSTTLIYAHEVDRLTSNCEDIIAGAIWN